MNSPGLISNFQKIKSGCFNSKIDDILVIKSASG